MPVVPERCCCAGCCVQWKHFRWRFLTEEIQPCLSQRLWKEALVLVRAAPHAGSFSQSPVQPTPYAPRPPRLSRSSTALRREIAQPQPDSMASFLGSSPPLNRVKCCRFVASALQTPTSPSCFLVSLPAGSPCGRAILRLWIARPSYTQRVVEHLNLAAYFQAQMLRPLLITLFSFCTVCAHLTLEIDNGVIGSFRFLRLPEWRYKKSKF